jgi:hypothetical protein
MISREPEGEVGAPASVKLVTVPCGNLEACPQAQGMGTFNFVPVQLKSCRQANIPDTGIALIDPEEIRTIALIVEKKTSFRCLITATLWKAKGIVIILDEAVKKPTVLEDIGDLEAKLETLPNPEASRQIEVVRLTV